MCLCLGIDASYVTQLVACPLPLGSIEHAAVALLCELLSRTEGPLYMAVRGKGHAYGADVNYYRWAGQLAFVCREATAPDQGARARGSRGFGKRKAGRDKGGLHRVSQMNRSGTGSLPSSHPLRIILSPTSCVRVCARMRCSTLELLPRSRGRPRKRGQGVYAVRDGHGACGADLPQLRRPLERWTKHHARAPASADRMLAQRQERRSCNRG